MTEGVAPASQPVGGINFSLFDGFCEDAAHQALRGVGVLAGGDPGNNNIYRSNSDQTAELISFGQPSPGGFANFDGGSNDLSLMTFDIATTPGLEVTDGPTPPPVSTTPTPVTGPTLSWSRCCLTAPPRPTAARSARTTS